MLALDFKLTAGQVRLLLTIYAHADDPRCQTRDAVDPCLMYGGAFPYFISTVHALERKGLVVWQKDRMVGGVRRHPHHCTPRGIAIAETVIEQAQQILALAATRTKVRRIKVAR